LFSNATRITNIDRKCNWSAASTKSIYVKLIGYDLESMCFK
jgi:hypothetical protein